MPVLCDEKPITYSTTVALKPVKIFYGHRHDFRWKITEGGRVFLKCKVESCGYEMYSDEIIEACNGYKAQGNNS